MPVSGEVMFSDEWMVRNGTAYMIPLEAWNFLRAICRDHNLGNDRDMLMVWLTVKDNKEAVVQALATLK